MAMRARYTLVKNREKEFYKGGMIEPTRVMWIRI